MIVKGELDETDVDAQSIATIEFSENISAEIKTAINENYENNLTVEAEDLRLEISDPLHCGQFNNGISSIKFINQGKEEIFQINDEVGLFTREIDEAANCIAQNIFESSLMSHKDTLGNILSLEKWYSKLGVIYPSNEIKNSLIVDHDFHLDSNLEKDTTEILGKSTPKVVFGCDNQISDLHAYCMFEHFYQQGGRIFDTAYIYNNGL